MGIRRAIGVVTALCFLVALALCGFMYLCAEPFVRILYRDVEPLLIEYAVRYMRLICISFVPFSIFNPIFHAFRNLGDTKSSLMLTLVINMSLLVFSLIFINLLGMGVDGSGLSFILARTVGMLTALVWLLAVRNDYSLRIRDFFRLNAGVAREIFSLALPLSGEAALLQVGMLIVQMYLAKLTTTDLAAHAVSNSILMLYNSTTNALLAFTGTVCGQCYGAKRYDLVRFYSRSLIRVGRYALVLTVLILYPFMPLLMKLYHATEAGRPIIYTCISIAVFSMPFLWCDGNMPAMVLRVAGDTVFAGIVSVSALVLCRCLVGYILTIPLGLGVPGVWIALVLEWILRAAAYRVRMRKERWMHLKKQPE